MKSLLPIDEINALKTAIEEGKPTINQLVDSVTELFILAYVLGVKEANEMLGTNLNWVDWEVQDALDKKYDGVDYIGRLKQYAENGDYASIGRVIDTDAHRIFNKGAFNTAISGGAKFKVWHTMEDDRVRDTHRYLEGVETTLWGDFYTYDGDKALYPGGFSLVENNVNCRCFIEYIK